MPTLFEQVLADRANAKVLADKTSIKAQSLALANQAKAKIIADKVDFLQAQKEHDIINKALIESAKSNSDRTGREHLQDLGSLTGRAVLGIGQLAYGGADLVTDNLNPIKTADKVRNFVQGNGFNSTIPSLDQLTTDSNGESISQKFQRSKDILHSLESDPLQARRAVLDKRSRERDVANAAFDATNPNIFQDAIQGVKNFGSGVADLAEFGTVGLDTAAESLPQALVPGGITKLATKSLVTSVGKEAVKKLAKDKLKKATFTKLVPKNKLVKDFSKTAANRELLSEVRKATVKGTTEYLASTAGKKAVNKIAARTGLTFTGISEGISNAGEVQATVLNTSEKDLNESSSEYRKLRKQGKSHEQAKRILADNARDITAAIAGLTGALAGHLTGASKLEGKGFKIDPKKVKLTSAGIEADTPLAKKLFAKLKGNPVVEGLKTEGIEETSQGATGQLASNIALKQTSNDNQKLGEGVVGSAAQGLVAGALSGGGLAGIANIPKGTAVTAKTIGKGVQKVADKVEKVNTLRKLEPAAKEAIKSNKGASELVGKDPLAAAQVLLHPSTLKANKDNIDEHLKTAQEQVNLLTKDRETTREELAGIAVEIRKIALENQKTESEGGTVSDADNKRAEELTAKFQELNDKNKQRNQVIEDFQATLDKFSVKETGTNAQRANNIADRLINKPADKLATSDLEDNNSKPLETTAPDGTVTKEDLNYISGSDPSIFSQPEEVLAAIEKHPEATPEIKSRIKEVRELKDTKGVSAEIAGDNKNKNSSEFTGILGHVSRILSNKNNAANIANYQNFKQGIQDKLKYAKILFNTLDGHRVSPSEEDQLAAQVFFHDFLVRDNENTGRNRTIADLNINFFDTLIKQVPKDLKQFALADKILAERGVANLTAVEGTRAGTAPVPETSSGEQSTSTPTVDTNQTTTPTESNTEQSTAIDKQPIEPATSKKPTVRETVKRLNTITLGAAKTAIQAAAKTNKNLAKIINKISQKQLQSIANKLSKKLELTPIQKDVVNAINAAPTADTERSSEASSSEAKKTTEDGPDVSSQEQKPSTPKTDTTTAPTPSKAEDKSQAIQHLNAVIKIKDRPKEEKNIRKLAARVRKKVQEGITLKAALLAVNEEEYQKALKKEYSPQEIKELTNSEKLAIRKEALAENTSLTALLAELVKSFKENPTVFQFDLFSNTGTKQGDSAAEESTPPVGEKSTANEPAGVGAVKASQEPNSTATDSTKGDSPKVEEGVDTTNAPAPELDISGIDKSDSKGILKQITEDNNLTKEQVNAIQLFVSNAGKKKINERLNLIAEILNNEPITLDNDGAIRGAQKLIDDLELKIKPNTYLASLFAAEDLADIPEGKNNPKKFPLIEKVLNKLFRPKSSTSIVNDSSNVFSLSNTEDFQAAVVKKMGVKSWDDLSKAQQEGATKAWQFTRKFTKEFRKANPSFHPASLRDNSVGYFARKNANGQLVLDDNVIAALALSAFAYSNNSLKKSAFRTDRDLRSLLGLTEKDFKIPNNIYTFLWHAGTVQSTIAEQVGRDFMNIIGVDIQDTTQVHEKNIMAKAAGNMVFNTMIDMGLMENVYVPSELFELAKDDLRVFGKTQPNNLSDKLISAEEVDAYKENQKNNGLSQKVTRFIRPVVNNRGTQEAEIPAFSLLISEALNDTESMGQKLLGVEYKQSDPSLVAPTNRITKNNKGSSDINPEVADIAVESSQQPLRPNKNEFKLANILGIDKLLDLIRLPIDHPDRVVNAGQEEAVKAQIAQRERSLTDFFNYMKKHDFENNPELEFYLAKEFWTSYRMGEASNTITPQGNKIIRSLVGYTSHNVSHKTKPSSLDEQLDLFGFKTAVVQALGGKIDRMTFEQVEDAFDDAVAQLNDETTDLYQGTAAVNEILQNGKATEENIDGLSKIIERDGDEPLLQLNAAIALNSYFTAIENGDKTFDTNLHIEVDGVTNGFAITLMQTFSSSIARSPREVMATFDELIEKNNEFKDGETVYNEDNIGLLHDGTKLTKLGKEVYARNAKQFLDFAVKQRFERVGLFNENSKSSSTGEYIGKEKGDDSYQDLGRTLNKAFNYITNLLNPKTKGENEKLDKEIKALQKVFLGIFPGKPYNEARAALIKHIPHKVFLPITRNSPRKAGVPAAAQKLAIEIGEVVGNDAELQQTLNNLQKYSPMGLESLLAVMEDDLTLDEIKTRAQGVNNLVGPLVTESNEDGIINQAVTKLGRDISKPALLISNYGASINNIVRTFAEDVTNRMIDELNAAQALINKKTPEDLVDAEAIIDRLNKDVGSLLVESRITFTRNNLTNVIPNVVLNEMQSRIQEIHGVALKHTLNHKYGDLFETRQKLNAITSLTFTLFDKLYKAIEQEFLPENQESMTKEQQRQFEKKIADLIPFYETYFSNYENYSEGVLGPNVGNEIQNEDPAYATRVDSIDPKTGKKRTIKGAASKKVYAHPSSRIQVMLTHALDSAVQAELMRELNKLNMGVLNIHDAATFASTNTKQFSDIYNQAFMKVMTGYSIPSAINAPLTRIYEEMEKNYPFHLEEVEKDIDAAIEKGEWGKVKNSGYFQLADDYAAANVFDMVSRAQFLTKRMTNEKEGFLNDNPIFNVSQYAVSDNSTQYDHSKNENVHDRVTATELSARTTTKQDVEQEQLAQASLQLDKSIRNLSLAIEKLQKETNRMNDKNPQKVKNAQKIQQMQDSLSALKDRDIQITEQIQTTFHSSPSAENLTTNFTPDETKTLDANNVQAVFDSLTGKGIKNENPSHVKTLSKVINDVIKKVITPTTLYTRTKNDKTVGAFSPNEKRGNALGAVYINYAAKHPNTPNLTESMSAQEVYVHELVHSVIGNALDSDGRLLSEVNKLFTEVRDSGISFEVFMPPGLVESDPTYAAAKLEAEEKFKYIFENQRTHNREYTDITTGEQRVHILGDGLHEFMTFAVTNENFMNALKKIKIKNLKDLPKNATLFEKALNIFNKILNYFNGTIRKKDFITADKLAFNLVSELSSIHETNNNKSKQAAGGLTSLLWNGYSKGFDATIGKLAKVTTEKLRISAGLKEEEFKPKNYYDAVIEFGKVLGTQVGAKHDGLAFGLLNELSPRSVRNSFLHTLSRNKNKLIDKAVQKLMSNVATFFDQAFTVLLDKDSKRAITRTAVKLDMRAMADTHTVAEMAELLLNPDKLQAEINKYEAKLKTDHPSNHVYYRTMSKNLGQYLVTENQTDHATMMNAHLIANLKHTGLEEEGDLDVAEQDIDVLTTLYGMQANSSLDNRIVGNLMQTQPDAMQSVIDILKVNHEVRINNNFDGNPAQTTKGYVKENYSQHLSFRIGKKSDKDQMAKDGYYSELPLSNNPGDNTEQKFIYVNKFADLSTRTSGAISLADNHTRGTLIEQSELGKVDAHYKQAILKATKGIHTPVKPTENAATPIVDSTGKVTDYRYTVSRHVKEGLLQSDTDFSSVIARLETTTILRPRTDKLNKELIQAAFDEFSGVDVAANGAAYVSIGPDAKGKLKEYWHMLPEQAQRDAEAIFGRKEIILPRDGLIMAMGAPNWSTQSLKQKDINPNDPTFKKVMGNLNNYAALLLNNPKVNLAESYLREGVAFAKDAIVIKSGIVLLGNEVSNIMTLLVEGVPFRQAISGQVEGIRFAQEYAINADKLMQIKIKLRTARNLSPAEISSLKANEVRLNTLINNNPVSELMDAGLHQTLVEDVGDLDTNPNSIGRLEKKLRGNKIVKSILSAKKGKYGDAVKVIGSELLMTHNSTLYQFLRDGTQLSDFAARYVLHKHNLKKGMASADSISHIEDTFINYDLPSHPFLQLGNDLGFLMFTKFFFRIQPIIARQAINNPKQFLLMLLSQGLIGDIDDISDSVMSLKHLLYKFNNPLGTLMDLPGTPLISGTVF